MHPFFALGPVRLPAYGVLAALGAALGLALFLGRTARGERRRALWTALLALLGALLGAKALYLLTAPPGLALREQLLAGAAFYGGLAGGARFGAWAARALRLPALPLLDRAAPALALGHGVGRVGCFLAGCCYGRPAEPPWGIVLAEALGAPRDVPLFPAQLLEAGCNLLLCALLLLYARRRRAPGQVFGLYLLLYAAERFALEFLRGDGVRGFAAGLSTSQWGAIGGALLGLALLLRVLRLELRLCGASLSVRLGALEFCAALRRDAAGRLALQKTLCGYALPEGKRGGGALARALLRELPRILRVETLEMRLRLGVAGDASATARLCGALFALGAAARALLPAQSAEAAVRLIVEPDWKRDCFFARGHCILWLDLGQCTCISARLLCETGKGAFRKWRTRLKRSCAPPWKT